MKSWGETVAEAQEEWGLPPWAKWEAPAGQTYTSEAVCYDVDVRGGALNERWMGRALSGLCGSAKEAWREARRGARSIAPSRRPTSFYLYRIKIHGPRIDDDLFIWRLSGSGECYTFRMDAAEAWCKQQRDMAEGGL